MVDPDGAEKGSFHSDPLPVDIILDVERYGQGFVGTFSRRVIWRGEYGAAELRDPIQGVRYPIPRN